MAESPLIDDLPEAIPTRGRHGSPHLIWIIPILAAVIGGWIAIQAVLERGPTVSISFRTAEGLEPGKTRIRYKDVDIGEVQAITISKDRKRIIVTAQFITKAEDYLTEDTRFWVVRPQFSGGQISGVGTLLSGAYIAMDAGKSTRSRREFTGLEVAPILTGDLPGRQFMLDAPDLGSLDVGSPVYFRRIRVGEVIAHELDPTGDAVNIRIFVHSPYERYVTTASRFWNASGVDLALDASGMRVETQSLASILTGGLAFETPPNAEKAQEAPEETRFALYKDRAGALRWPDDEALSYILHFKDSLRGLTVGAPVDFRGIVVGEVQSIDVHYDPIRRWFDFPVHVTLYPHRMDTSFQKGTGEGAAEQTRTELFKSLVERGFRAQLRMGNLLTGQLYVALEFFPDASRVKMDWTKRPLELPTVPGTVEELQQSVAGLLKRIDKIPLEDIGRNTRDALTSIDSTARSLTQLLQRLDRELTPESRAVLSEIRKTLADVETMIAADSPLQQDLQETLRETTRTARSLRVLTDSLVREPESLLRGRATHE